MSKKKIITIAVVGMIALVIIGGIAWWKVNSGNEMTKEQEEQERSITEMSKIYTELEQKQTYQVTLTLDDQNEILYMKKEGKAYIETKYQGQTSKLIIKDGNSYLLMEDSKKYYTYQNNETDLGKIEIPFEKAKDSEPTEGKEKIDKKEYKYEEYEGIADFLMKDVKNEEEIVKTRFYFNDDKLVYIKTIVGDYQETLKVDITDTVDEKVFEIPSDYKEV